MTSPDYSIIVPVYNVEPYLRECTDSILAQSFGNFELLLVDDGSSDGSPAICDEYAAKDSRVTVIHQPNRGVAAARKAGLDRARADYVCFVDSDDTVRPDMLETLERCAAANGRPDIIIHGVSFSFGDRLENYPPSANAGYYDRARMEKELWPYMLYDGRRPFFSKLLAGFVCCRALRRELVCEHFLQDLSIRLYEDVIMSYECVCAAQSLYICPECLYLYRMRDDSRTHIYPEDFLLQIRKCADYLNSHLVRQFPFMRTQSNVYIVARVMDGPVTDLTAGFSLGETIHRFRQGIRRSGLVPCLRMEGLPPLVRLYVMTLKCHLYSLSVLLVRLRMTLS